MHLQSNQVLRIHLAGHIGLSRALCPHIYSVPRAYMGGFIICWLGEWSWKFPTLPLHFLPFEEKEIPYSYPSPWPHSVMWCTAVKPRCLHSGGKANFTLRTQSSSASSWYYHKTLAGIIYRRWHSATPMYLGALNYKPACTVLLGLAGRQWDCVICTRSVEFWLNLVKERIFWLWERARHSLSLFIQSAPLLVPVI